MLAFDLVSIVLFLFHPSIFWRGEERLTDGVWVGIDLFIAVIITLDLAARFYIERYKAWFFLRITYLADLVVAAALLIPLFCTEHGLPACLSRGPSGARV